jgi:ApbE superfamily uncharacterized protein (UPF0280 family)
MIARRLPDGRLHLNDGPIDLICFAEGSDAARALEQAATALEGLLARLVLELPLLRRPLGPTPPELQHPVARRMAAACAPFAADGFITPMAAVAGSVADHVLAAMRHGTDLHRAYVNNGGDIALHLAPGASLSIGLVRDLAHGRAEGSVAIAAAMPVRGVATSGWPGRSFSRGIAEAVTVLARSAAAADAAATVIANAVDADDPAVRRAAASTLDPDSDLGDLPVTVAVGELAAATVAQALAAGLAVAEALRAEGRIAGALLCCQGRSVATRELPAVGS